MSVNAVALPGMPEPWTIRRLVRDGEVFVLRGPHVFAHYEEHDRGMRNLAVVALSDAGFSVNEVAECFSLTRQYVSMLRGRAKKQGSAGLVRRWGRSSSLTPEKWARALELSRKGMTDVEIAKRFGVHSGTVGRQLARLRDHKGAGDQQELLGVDEAEEEAEVEEEPETEAPPEGKETDERAGVVKAEISPLPRLVEATVPSRYAGAMLLHPFFSRLGIDDLLRALRRGGARRYDATSLVLAAVFGFALGISSLEGSKHLRVRDSGALTGLWSFPHLRTLRPALKDLARSCDPLEVQALFAKAMLASDKEAAEVFYVDDHFVTYWGKAPVQKGYNVRRHLAEPGRDDTFVTDEHSRAIVFSSGEPRGLSVSIFEVLDQLGEVTDHRSVLVGFDRGGSYPKVFAALAERGMDWVTWRRAPLVVPTAAVRRAWTVRDGKRRYLQVADEEVIVKGYDKGPVRQLSSFENGKVVFQVLTSDTGARPGPLVAKLRGRWCIENFNKYIEDHHGAHWLSSYEMEIEPNTALVANPERRRLRAAASAAKATLSEAERALGQAMDASYETIEEHVAVIGERRDEVAFATDVLADAKAALKGVPAKMPTNSLDPDATRAKPALATRALQMVCRLLAYNAELDLACRLDNYLDDPDEYRSITRNLLHLGGTITYERKRILVNLERPDSPRIARALSELVSELNGGQTVCLPGDSRPLVYQITAK